MNYVKNPEKYYDFDLGKMRSQMIKNKPKLTKIGAKLLTIIYHSSYLPEMLLDIIHFYLN